MQTLYMKTFLSICKWCPYLFAYRVRSEIWSKVVTQPHVNTKCELTDFKLSICDLITQDGWKYHVWTRSLRVVMCCLCYLPCCVSTMITSSTCKWRTPLSFSNLVCNAWYSKIQSGSTDSRTKPGTGLLFFEQCEWFSGFVHTVETKGSP